MPSDIAPFPWMNQLQLYPLDITLAPLKPWTLSQFPEVAFRGALGRAMFKGLCERDDGRCDRCALSTGCLIPSWYDPARTGGNQIRPFTLSVKHDPGQRITKVLRLRLTLLGRPPRPSALFEALFRMARHGLGDQRIPHRLQQISLHRVDGPLVLFKDGEQLHALPHGATLAQACAVPTAPLQSVSLFLERPISLRHEGLAPTPADLLLSAIGRVRQVARAQDITLSCHWPDPVGVNAQFKHLHKVVGASRRSSHRGYQPLEGWQGVLTITREANVFADLLVASELLHIGQSSSAGLGQVRATWRSIS